jgi:hypothetical protein
MFVPFHLKYLAFTMIFTLVMFSAAHSCTDISPSLRTSLGVLDHTQFDLSSGIRVQNPLLESVDLALSKQGSILPRYLHI